MIKCSVCGELVNNTLLRTTFPKCSNGHALGEWVHCENGSEKHVFLKDGNRNCPYCNNMQSFEMVEGAKVKCLSATADGALCQTRPFLWIKEGPPCLMNHVAKMMLLS